MVTVREGEARFLFYRPGAHSVHLTGDFNGWRTEQLPMERRKDGYWRASLRLPGGFYHFSYIADGTWYADYAAFGVEPSPHGLVSGLQIARNTSRGSKEPGDR